MQESGKGPFLCHLSLESTLALLCRASNPALWSIVCFRRDQLLAFHGRGRPCSLMFRWQAVGVTPQSKPVETMPRFLHVFRQNFCTSAVVLDGRLLALRPPHMPLLYSLVPTISVFVLQIRSSAALIVTFVAA